MPHLSFELILLLASAPTAARPTSPPPAVAAPPPAAPAASPSATPTVALSHSVATFAGGWSLEADFEKLDGVIEVISGYAGGQEPDPTYRQVSEGKTGHAEVVQVLFKPSRISYEQLLDFYWAHIDPTTPDRQFCEVGPQFRTAILYHDDTQKELAFRSKKAIDAKKRFPEPIVTQIVRLEHFYPAEERHQNYAQKSPKKYHLTRRDCGRDERLVQLWGPSPKK